MKIDLKVFQILIALLLSAIVFLFVDREILGVFYFYVLIILISIDILYKRKIELIHVWNAAFVFIILSEVFTKKFGNGFIDIEVLQYFIFANNIIFIGYVIQSTKTISFKDYVIRSSKFVPIAFLACEVIFIYFKIESALLVFSSGRVSEDMGESFVLDSLVSPLGFVLPAVIVYYFSIVLKKPILQSLLWAFPIFLIQFLIGTRFPLLFSVLGFILVASIKFSTTKFNLKKVIIIISSLILLLVVAEFMKTFRLRGLNNSEVVFQEDIHESETVHEWVLNYGSPEGVLVMNTLLFEHFEHRPHLYGSNIGFLLYFWIPRSLWSDKPTLLGNWFVRIYQSGFSEDHSVSFGFAGELYADFGYYSLLLVFFIGRLLKNANSFLISAMNSKGFQLVLGAMLLPYSFFFVRSPITATMNFLGVLFFYYLFKRLIFQEE
ncbi:MAG: hypothetical protein WBG46_02830 [Nonlabens sp.]